MQSLMVGEFELDQHHGKNKQPLIPQDLHGMTWLTDSKTLHLAHFARVCFQLNPSVWVVKRTEHLVPFTWLLDVNRSGLTDRHRQSE